MSSLDEDTVRLFLPDVYNVIINSEIHKGIVRDLGMSESDYVVLSIIELSCGYIVEDYSQFDKIVRYAGVDDYSIWEHDWVAENGLHSNILETSQIVARMMHRYLTKKGFFRMFPDCYFYPTYIRYPVILIEVMDG